MTRVLLVDDDRQLVRALQITLSARGYSVVPAHSRPTS
jgi:ActR/RegA family two-component response regulator